MLTVVSVRSCTKLGLGRLRSGGWLSGGLLTRSMLGRGCEMNIYGAGGSQYGIFEILQHHYAGMSTGDFITVSVAIFSSKLDEPSGE